MFHKLLGKVREARKQQRNSSRGEQLRRFFPQLEHLEKREMLDGTAVLYGGVLHVDCYDSTSPDTVVLDHTGSSATVAIDGQATKSFSDNLYNAIQIDGGGHGITTFIRGNARPVTFYGHHEGDIVHIGDGFNRMQSIQANLNIFNPLGHNSVNIHDEGDLSARTALVEADVDYERITVLGSAMVSCAASSTNSLTLNTGSAGSTVNVFGTASFFGGGGTTVSQRGSSDVVNVGSNGPAPGTLATINGPLTVVNGPDYSDLNLHDELDGANRTAYITALGISGLSNVPVYTTSSSTRNLTVNGGTGDNTYYIGGTPAHSSFTLNTGAGHDTTNLQGNVVPTTITTTTGNGGGNDVVNLGTSAGSLSGIQGPVTISNGPNYDQINIDGSADGGNHEVTIANAGASAGVTGLAPAPIHFDAISVSTLSVRGGPGNNIYTVADTPASTSVTLDTGSGSDITSVQSTSARLAITTTTGGGGGGNDSVFLGDSSSGITRITHAVTILNNRSTDQIDISDVGDAADHPDVEITSTGQGGMSGISGLAPAPINFTSSTCSSLSVYTGSGKNAVTIPSTPASTNVTVVTDPGGAAAVNLQGNNVPVSVFAEGSDTVTLSNAARTVAGISNVTVNGSTNSAVVVDDSSYIGDEIYSITNTSVNVARLHAPLLSYGEFGALGEVKVLGGQAANQDEFIIDSTSCPVDIQGGAGPNYFIVTPYSNSLAAITAPLNLSGSGADVIYFWDQYNPASETYNFDSVPSRLTLTTLPVAINFSGMGGGIYLQTNGMSTVNDPSGMVTVDE